MLSNTAEDASIGYIIEIDAYFPEEIHGKFKEFPHAPESIAPNVEWLSDYQKEVGLATNTLKLNEKRGS